MTKVRGLQLLLNFPQRRVIAYVAGTQIGERQKDIHNLKVMNKRQRIADVIDTDEIDDHFDAIEHVRLQNMSDRNRAIAEGKEVPTVLDQREDRYGEERKFRFRSGDIHYLRTRLKDPNIQLYGLLPEDSISTAKVLQVEIEDEDDVALEGEEYFEVEGDEAESEEWPTGRYDHHHHSYEGEPDQFHHCNPLLCKEEYGERCPKDDGTGDHIEPPDALPEDTEEE